MAFLTDFFCNEITGDLWKMLINISRKTFRCKSSAEQLITYVREILPIIEEIKYSGVELPAPRQSELDRLSEILRSGVELSHEALATSRWNVYRKFQLAKKMDKLEQHVTNFLQVPMQAHVMADVHHVRFEMAERFDRMEASNRRMEKLLGEMKIGVNGGGWVEEAVRGMQEDETWVEGCNSFGVGLEFGKSKVMEMVFTRCHDVCVVGICGIGGSGKTTLARELCRDDQVRCKLISQNPFSSSLNFIFAKLLSWLDWIN